MRATPRIAVVGAGPGGLSLARLLTERGFADVTVFERADRVGGKSLTWKHEGVPHEMGTCYLAAGYTTSRRWMKEAGLGEHRLTKHYIRTRDGGLVDFKEFVLGPGGKLGAVGQLSRYVAEWMEFHDWDLRGGPSDYVTGRGTRMVDEVAKPFGQWLSERGYDVVARFSLRTMTAMGYGPLDTVPALYGLRWNMPSLLWSAITLQVTEPVQGWQCLWVSLANNLDVRLSHEIVGVQRVGGRIRLEFAAQHAETFDHLVLTGPLDEAAKFYPFTEEERVGFAVDPSRLEWHSYVTTLVDARGWFTDADTRSFEAHLQDSRATAKGQLLVARRTASKTAVAAARPNRPDVYVCYQYGVDGLRLDGVTERLRADLAAEGVEDPTVLKQCGWKYAPQLTPGAIRDGAVARMERQQGAGNVWVTGASASHEAVDNIVDFNERLVDRMEVAFAGGDPSAPEVLERIAAKYRGKLHDK